MLGRISDAHATDALASLLLDWTGGSPWLTSYALSFINAAYREDAELGIAVDITSQVRIALQAAESAFVFSDVKLADGPLRDFALNYLTRIQQVLGSSEPTDGSIERAWLGPSQKRHFGFDITSRVERFVASGLAWLDGEPWEPAPEDLDRAYVFRRYPTVYFAPAGRLAVAVYRAATGRDIRVSSY